MKKVLIINDSMDIGGVEKVLINLLNHLDKGKYQLYLLLLYKVDVWEKLIPQNVEVEYLFNRKPSKIAKWIRLLIFQKFYKSPVLKEKYDVTIVFKEWMCFYFGFLTKTSTKTFCWIHGIDPLRFPENRPKTFNSWFLGTITSFIKILRLSVYKKWGCFVCVSKTTMERFCRLHGLEEKTVVCYNPNDEKEIINLSKEKITDLEISKKFKIISVGRFTIEKGYDRLLQIHKKLINDNFDYELWILGDGEMKEELDTFILENKLEDSIKLLGFQNNPYKYMNAADLFICPSRYEGFSTVATEAIILGIPIITTDCAGMHELLDDGKSGMIVENNTEALYEGLKKILSDKSVLALYKQKAVDRSEFYKIKNSIDTIEKLIN